MRLNNWSITASYDTSRTSPARAGPGRRTKEVTMTIKLVALVLLCLMTGTAVA